MVSRTASGIVFAVGVAVAAVCLVTDPPGDALLVLNLAGMVVATALLWRRIGPNRDLSSHWRLLLVGVGIYTAAGVLGNVAAVVDDGAPSFPAVSDGLYMLSFATFGAFLIGVLRARSDEPSHGRLALVDAGIFTVAASSVLWLLVIRSNVVPFDIGLLARVFVVAYPVAAGLLFGLCLRIALTNDTVRMVDVVLVVWAGAEFVGDIVYGYAAANGSFSTGNWAFIGWVIVPTALAALALHPGLFGLAEPRPTRPAGRFRNGLLLLGSMTPLVLTLFSLQTGSGDELAAFVVATALAFGLVMLRMSLVSGDLDTQRLLTAELERLSEELRHRSLHDPLTGLGNRTFLAERMAHALLRRPSEDGAGAALIVLDLDGFKVVNDSLGHDAGDTLLVQVGARLTECLRPADSLARLGGDEFAIVLEDVDPTRALRIGRRVVEVMREPVSVAAHAVPARASVGICLADPDADVETVLRNADLAMYAAKGYGGDRLEIFDPALHEAFLARHRLEIDLREAPRRGQLRLYYQPVIELTTNAVIGVEALVRWQHPERGLLYPDAFIGLAEESGAVIAVGRWVLAEACRQLQAWSASGLLPSPFHMAVNLSRRQLLDPDIVDDVAGAVRASGVDPSQVILEITETALMANTDLLTDKLEKLRAFGVTIAMDDFGTGYSSLDQLRRLPVDILKIDRAFVAGIDQGGEDFALATAIVKLAASLGKLTLAEGVETPAQLAHLRALNAGMAQGYLFSRPQPPDVVERLWTGA